MPTLTIVAGPNGSGKTTLTRWGREAFQHSAVLDPDSIARSMRATVDDRAGDMEAGKTVLRLAAEMLAERQSFLVETTLSGNTYIRMMSQAKNAGYHVVLLFVGTADLSINLQRVQDRVGKGGHDVPEEDQRRRYPRSFANMRKALELADEAVLFDNSTAKGHTKVSVKAEGRYELVKPLPSWADFLHDFTR